MGNYRLGTVIKLTRTIQKLSQEKLSGDICSVETLSRIENGKQKPSKEIYEKLMLRLGKEQEKSFLDLEVEDYKLLEQTNKIRDFLHYLNFKQAEQALNELRITFTMDNKSNRQYFTFMEAIIAYQKKNLNLLILNRN